MAINKIFWYSWAITVGLAFLCASSQAQNLSIDVRSAFEGSLPSQDGGALPLVVSLENKGPDASGVLVVSSQGFYMQYPVQLPRGAHKKVDVIVTQNYFWDDINFTLATNRGRITAKFMPEGPSYGAVNLLISDVLGEMSFMRGDIDSYGSPYSEDYSSTNFDSYVKPEDAPTRPSAYSGITTIILGTGAERLTNDAIEAILLSGLKGSNIVFLGGASAPILSDPRWASILPVTDFKTKTITGSSFLSKVGDSPFNETVTVTTGTPTPDAEAYLDGNTLIYARRSLGLGKVVYLSCNPFESPINRWEGRKGLLVSAMKNSERLIASSQLERYYFVPNEFSSGSTIHTPRVASVQRDPFSTTLPPAKKIFTLLASYFIVVVPLNFIVLRKFKRGELAWVTAPIISLGFAGAFFTFAADLYNAKLSTATTGVLIAQEGVPNGIFLGTTQLFFPYGGRYDLKLDHVDSFLSSADRYSYTNTSDIRNFNAIDTGEIQISELRTSNLSFKQMIFMQIVPCEDWLDVQITRKDNTSLKAADIRITNKSPYKIENVHVTDGNQQFSLKQIEAGESITRKFTNHVNKDTRYRGDIADHMSRFNGLVISGNLRGFEPGPQIGTTVASRQSIRFVYGVTQQAGATR